MTEQQLWQAGPALEPSTMEDGLAGRFAALDRLCRAARDYADDDELAAARELVARGSTRLSLSDGSHTVVALAGATGVGKSSLFNAIARHPLSTPGHLRPTTSAAWACVWDERGADPLLDWLVVAPQRRFRRESALDADDEAELRGLVLLDLPDMDSVAGSHRLEADRLVGMVDLVIWVLDPQKYADQSVHEQYLSNMGPLRDVTVVVFNQTDRLAPADAQRCRLDLAHLLEADGLPGVPVLATSTVTDEGIEELRTLLAKVVAGRGLTRARLEGEFEAAVTRLAPLAPVDGPSELELSRVAVPELADGLAAAGAVTALATEAGATYRDATRMLALPWRHAKPLPDVPPADTAALALALRRLGERAATGAQGSLPDRWAEPLRAAAAQEMPRLPDDLAGTLAAARGPVSGSPVWTAARAGWWAAVAVTLAAVVGVVVAGGFAWLALAVLGGALTAAGLVIEASAGLRERHQRRVVEERLRLAVLTVARETIAPVRPILRAYDEVRRGLLDAAWPSRAPR